VRVDGTMTWVDEVGRRASWYCMARAPVWPHPGAQTPRLDGARRGVWPEAGARVVTRSYGAAEMAATCAAVSARSAAEPIPPTLALMAAWVAEAGRPFFPLPWQPAQSCV